MSAYIENLPDLSQGYCVLDCETSGLDIHNDRIIELCLLRVCPEKITINSALLQSVDLVPQVITHVTGITTEMLQELGEPPQEVFQRLFALDELQSLPLVGHNIIGFDRPMLLNEARRMGLESMAEQCLDPDRLVDTGALYKGLRLQEPPENGESHYQWASRVFGIYATGLHWNLGAAARSCGLRYRKEDCHRARADAELCYRILKRILKEEAKR